MNEEKKQMLIDNIIEGSLTIEDLDDFLVLFMEVCNNSEDIEEELEEWEKKIQFSLDDIDDFYFIIQDGKFKYEKGKVDDPDITLEMSGDTITGIFSGEIDATNAYMAGDLIITGPLPDAVKFRTLTELVREELEE